MKLIQKLVCWIRNQDWYAKHVRKPACPHGRTKHGFKVVLCGHVLEFAWADMCPACAAEYLKKYSTFCAACGGPIIPGSPVAKAYEGAPHPHPFTHANRKCCPCFLSLCGSWGEGCLISFHESDPKKYPAPD